MRHIALILSCLMPLAASDLRTWKTGTSTQITLEGGPGQFLTLKQAGIDAVEIVVTRTDTAEAAAAAREYSKQVRAWAQAAGVELWSIHVPYGRDIDPSNANEEQRIQVVANLSRLLDAYAPLGVKKLNIHASAEITKPIPLPEREIRIAAARKSLAELAGKAASIHAQLAVECLPRACLGNTGKEILRLIDGIPAMGVTLDTNHLLQEKNENFIRLVGRRIVSTHVADYDGIDEKHWLPGKGINDFTAIARGLQSAGYTGPFLFECAGTPEEKVAVWKQIRTKSAADAVR